MKKPSDYPSRRDDVRRKLIGLGEKSLRKSYYPQLRARLEELERFRALLDQSNDAIILMDVSAMEVVDASEAACGFLGVSKDRLETQSLERRIEFEPPWTLRNLGSAAGKEADREIDGVCYFLSGDGLRHPIEFTATLVEFANKNYLVFVGRDISQRLKAEGEKKELQAQLIQAQKMEAIGVLAGGIAHDFNNILATILGYSELALDEARDGKATPRELEQIINSTNRAVQLVGQILAFSRKAEPSLKPLNLNKVIRELNSMIERTIPRMISVGLDLEPNLRTINGDANQMDQVLLNLAANAKDAMPQGGRLTLRTENVTLEGEYTNSHFGISPGEYVLLTVSDTGHGMDKKTMEHIFEPFYTTKEVGKGTGLGLASSFGIVRSHGGHIFCYSEPGRGTVFKVYLPALEPGDAPDDTAWERVAPATGGTETILLVDDDQAIREIASRILENYGYRVITAGNGEEALAGYKTHGSGIDLVLMDISMPGMGGEKCLREILAISPAAKVVLASGYMRDFYRRDHETAGAAGFISKPFSKADLLRELRKVLDG